MPLNNKETMKQRQRQRSVSSDRGSQDEGDEGLEEPLRAKKRRESTMPVEGRCPGAEMLQIPSFKNHKFSSINFPKNAKTIKVRKKIL